MNLTRDQIVIRSLRGEIENERRAQEAVLRDLRIASGTDGVTASNSTSGGPAVSASRGASGRVAAGAGVSRRVSADHQH